MRPTDAQRPVGCGCRTMKVTCGDRTPSVPPEKTVMAEDGMRDFQTCALSVLEKSLTQPFPAVGNQRKLEKLEGTRRRYIVQYGQERRLALN